MGRKAKTNTRWKGRFDKKVKIGWELYQKGYHPTKYLTDIERKTPYIVGDKKDPIAIGKKGDLIVENLDREFYEMLDDAYNHLSGFRTISADDPTLTIGYIYATRYLVLNIMREYGIGKLWFDNQIKKCSR